MKWKWMLVICLTMAVTLVTVPVLSAELMTGYGAAPGSSIRNNQVSGDTVKIQSVKYSVRYGSNFTVRQFTLAPAPGDWLQIPINAGDMVIISAKVRFIGPAGKLGFASFYDNTDMTMLDCKTIPANKVVTLRTNYGIRGGSPGSHHVITLEVAGDGQYASQPIDIAVS